MKPQPFSSLNHFTLPTAIGSSTSSACPCELATRPSPPPTQPPSFVERAFGKVAAAREKGQEAAGADCGRFSKHSSLTKVAPSSHELGSKIRERGYRTSKRVVGCAHRARV